MYNKKPPLRVLETFSGIGAQHKAIKIINKKFNNFIFEVVSNVDWDARANISYAAIHKNLEKEYKKILKKNNLNTEEEIDSFLKQFNFSLNSKTPSIITRKDYYFKKLLAASVLLTNNKVDITKLDPKILEKESIDLLTYSFPCQGLSIANMGRAKGILDEGSTSNLIWEIYRILKESDTKPKYLLMENVKNLLSNNFKDQYDLWKKNLDELGYNTFTITINAKDAGSIQKRERVFAISFRKDIKINIKDDNDFKKEIELLMSKENLDFRKRKERFLKTFDLSNVKKEESLKASINNTPSRLRIIDTQKVINENKDYLINTVTTKQDRIPCTGIIELKTENSKKLDYRFITPREAFALMGFYDEDFDNLKNLYNKNILTTESLYRQAGNSIVVEAIQHIFEFIAMVEAKQ